MFDQTAATLCYVLAFAVPAVAVSVGLVRDRLREFDRDVQWARTTPRPDGFDRAPRLRAVPDPALRPDQRATGMVVWTDEESAW